jgi:hypothetical protein
VLDTCAVLMVGVKGADLYQAQLTFAMARHAAVDLALVLKVQPEMPVVDRLTREEFQRLGEQLREAGMDLHTGENVAAKLTELRAMYEPFVQALAGHFLFSLPAFAPDPVPADNWQRSAWMQRTPGIGNLPTAPSLEEWHD